MYTTISCGHAGFRISMYSEYTQPLIHSLRNRHGPRLKKKTSVSIWRCFRQKTWSCNQSCLNHIQIQQNPKFPAPRKYFRIRSQHEDSEQKKKTAPKKVSATDNSTLNLPSSSHPFLPNHQPNTNNKKTGWTKPTPTELRWILYIKKTLWPFWTLVFLGGLPGTPPCHRGATVCSSASSGRAVELWRRRMRAGLATEVRPMGDRSARRGVVYWLMVES